MPFMCKILNLLPTYCDPNMDLVAHSIIRPNQHCIARLSIKKVDQVLIEVHSTLLGTSKQNNALFDFGRGEGIITDIGKRL